MKSFKMFMQESVTAVDILPDAGLDIAIPEIKNELNRNIDLLFNQSYVTVDAAVSRLRKLLAMYTYDLPTIDTDDNVQGTIKLTIGHHHLGYDEFKGPIKGFDDVEMVFSYKLVDGLYKCSADVK